MGADLACFTLDKLRFATQGDPIAAIVMCRAHRADRVMVAGRWTVRDSAITGLDVAALRRDHHAAARAFFALPEGDKMAVNI